MGIRTAVVKKGTNPLTVVKNTMKSAVDRFPFPGENSNGHHPYRLTDEVTVILHQTIIGGQWVTYIGPHGVYQSTITRRGNVGKPGEPHPNEVKKLRVMYFKEETEKEK